MASAEIDGNRALPLPVAGYFLLAGVSLFWGLNWPGMKIVLGEMTVWWFRAMSVGAGALGLLLIAYFSTGATHPKRSEILPLLICAVFGIVGWHLFTGFGVSMMPAGRASIIAFTMPVWATLFAIVFLGEAVTARRVFGLALGMVALVLLLIPVLDAVGGRLFGAGLMIASAISWGAATVIVKGANWQRGALTICGWQFLLGGVPLAVAAVVLGEPDTLFDLDARAGLAVAYSAIIPMIFCQAVWFAMVRRLPTSLASMVTLLVPPLGVFSANLMLGEVVGPFEIAALTMVVLALALVLPGFNWRASLRQPPASHPG